MEIDSIYVDGLRSELTSLAAEAALYFTKCAQAVLDAGLDPNKASFFQSQWDPLPEDLKQEGHIIRKKATDLGTRLLGAARVSPLLAQADEREFREDIRSLSACLLMKQYKYSEAYVVSEEDRVFGIAPAEQSESNLSINASLATFRTVTRSLFERMDFLAPTPENLPSAMVSSESHPVRKYRPNTAFIIMQINEQNARSEDVKNTIKDVCRDFGIKAIRSDEIEHQDVITQRILDEIATSEFLIADLTGERPSVYYEIGYAHASGKRPILFREKGTPLHFDLLVHNAPEYKNTTDLKHKLAARLESLTGKSPKSAT